MTEIYKTTRRLFADTPQIVVPPYQREYSWQPQQVEQLLADIENIKVSKHDDEIKVESLHFAGLLVFIDTHIDQNNVYELVDGQQRITTLSLIAAAAKDFISKALNEEAVNNDERQNLTNIKSAFDEYVSISARPFGTSRAKLVPNENDKLLFNLIIRNNDSYEEKLNKIEAAGKKYLKKKYFIAYDYIFKYFTENYTKQGVVFLINFFVKYDSGLTFIPFNTKSDTDAFNLFESLNDRGVNLSALDLIKNKVLQNASNSESRASFDEVWQEIFGREGIVEDNKSNAFIRTFLMLNKEHISQNQIYKTCKDILHDYESTNNFINNLKEYAIVWRKITQVITIENETIVQHIIEDDLSETLLLLNKTKVRQWYSVALATYKKYTDGLISHDAAKTILEITLKICIRFKILNKRFNIIEKKFPQLAKKINDIKPATAQEIVSSAILELNEVLSNNVSNQDLSNAFEKGVQFDDNDLAYVLLRILLKEKISHGLNFANTVKLTLEHILPESHLANWGSITDADEKKYSIGNMIIVALDKNSQLSNKNLAEKKRIYSQIRIFETVEKDGYRIDDFDQTRWISEGIKMREKEIIPLIKSLI